MAGKAEVDVARAGSPPASADLRARQPKAIQSALAVLEEVARCGPGVTAQEVSDNLSIPRATAYRLLNLLVQDEYIVRMPDLRGFALGRKVVQLAGLVGPSRPPRAARDIVEVLRSRLRCGIHLVLYDGDRLRVVDADPDFPLSEPARLSRYLDASAMGRLLLSELDHVGRRPVAATRHSPEEVKAIIFETQRLGYARQLAANRSGYGCLAVPIRDNRQNLIGSLCAVGPLHRIETPGGLLSELTERAGQLAPLLD